MAYVDGHALAISRLKFKKQIKIIVISQELRMISCLEKNFVATQKTIYSQPKQKVLLENGNILSTLTSINKLYQLKRVNILQINFNRNLAYMLEVMVKFRRPQNVNNFIRIKKCYLLKELHPIIFVSNIFPNSHLIQKCIHNQQMFQNSC